MIKKGDLIMKNINKKNVGLGSIGDATYHTLKNKRDDILTIIFTKGKLELEVKNIERVNVYNESMNIIFKDNKEQFINLLQVTYIE